MGNNLETGSGKPAANGEDVGRFGRSLDESDLRLLNTDSDGSLSNAELDAALDNDVWPSVSREAIQGLFDYTKGNGPVALDSLRPDPSAWQPRWSPPTFGRAASADHFRLSLSKPDVERMDSNASGSVDRSELKAALKVAGSERNSQAINGLLRDMVLPVPQITIAEHIIGERFPVAPMLGTASGAREFKITSSIGDNLFSFNPEELAAAGAHPATQQMLEIWNRKEEMLYVAQLLDQSRGGSFKLSDLAANAKAIKDDGVDRDGDGFITGAELSEYQNRTDISNENRATARFLDFHKDILPGKADDVIVTIPYFNEETYGISDGDIEAFSAELADDVRADRIASHFKFKEYVGKVNQEADQESFDALDDNKDGGITQDELVNHKSDESEIGQVATLMDEIFTKLDGATYTRPWDAAGIVKRDLNYFCNSLRNDHARMARLDGAKNSAENADLLRFGEKIEALVTKGLPFLDYDHDGVLEHFERKLANRDLNLNLEQRIATRFLQSTYAFPMDSRDERVTPGEIRRAFSAMDPSVMRQNPNNETMRYYRTNINAGVQAFPTRLVNQVPLMYSMSADEKARYW